MAFVIDLMLRENATQVGHPRLGLAVGPFAFPALQFLLAHGHARGVATEIHDGGYSTQQKTLQIMHLKKFVPRTQWLSPIQASPRSDASRQRRINFRSSEPRR